MKIESHPTLTQNQKDTPRYIKLADVARLLGVSTRTIHIWANDGKLQRHKITPRCTLFDLAEVLAIVSASRVTTTAPAPTPAIAKAS